MASFRPMSDKTSESEEQGQISSDLTELQAETIERDLRAVCQNFSSLFQGKYKF